MWKRERKGCHEIFPRSLTSLALVFVDSFRKGKSLPVLSLVLQRGGRRGRGRGRGRPPKTLAAAEVT
jgi:hypothetical protein